MSLDLPTSPPQPSIHALFTGGPKRLHDARGDYHSSIAREEVHGPAQLALRGFVGDRNAQDYHGTLDTAVCFHALSHYAHWNSTLGMALKPGSVGENLTLDGADDQSICVGDVYRLGTARVQVSAPRGPCETQARFVGRPDWVKLTLQALRTGLYARVLTPGTVQAGDAFLLEQRPNPGLSILELNRCWHHQFDPYLARLYIEAEGLMDWWQGRLRQRLAALPSQPR